MADQNVAKVAETRELLVKLENKAERLRSHLMQRFIF